MRAEPQVNDSTVRAFRDALLDWYDAEGRTLPWRARPGDPVPDAYAVWLSEVMLQQTTVAHATPYWRKFLKAFPSVCDLARADSDTVMGMWAGLGYYARARNLHACAKTVCDDLDGDFPTSEADLLKLPGIGPYTAAAIAAICGGEATNVVDGNVERVVSRLFAVETPLPKARPELRRLAAQLVRDDRPGDYPQALMDLGATVCRPRNPSCRLCPVSAFCEALQDGDPERYPVKPKRMPIPTRYGHAFVSVRDDKVWLQRRPESGLLGGTLGFPTTEWDDTPQPDPGGWQRAGEVRHVFSHFQLDLAVMVGSDQVGEGEWRHISTMASLPSLMRKVWTSAEAKLDSV